MAKARTLVGLDVHATTIVAAVLDAETGELRTFRMSGEGKEAAAFCAGLPSPVRAAYEAGPTGYGLARELAVDGGEAVGVETPPQPVVRAPEPPLNGVELLGKRGILTELGIELGREPPRRLRDRPLHRAIGVCCLQTVGADLSGRLGWCAVSESVDRAALLVGPDDSQAAWPGLYDKPSSERAGAVSRIHDRQAYVLAGPDRTLCVVYAGHVTRPSQTWWL